jgi:hypothetical protein
MGFLDNSGDIILDAVLTDAGRQRLAKADGTFKIVQFALGDDEINYGLYDKTNASGSAYYDLSIMQTPVFEAFTNNIASLNSKLLTIPRNDLLFLPVMKLNTKITPVFSSLPTNHLFDNTFVVLVSQDTETGWNTDVGTSNVAGVFYGISISDKKYVSIDQGIDSTQVGSQATPIDADLKETQYTIEIDNRLGIIQSKNATSVDYKDATKSFVDDDNVALYQFSLGADNEFVTSLTTSQLASNLIIAGPQGTRLEFRIRPSIDVQSNTYLFNLLGTSTTIGSSSYKVIKTNVVVTGLTTGYSVTIPIAFVRKS